MLHIDFICVGKLKEAFWREACAEYAKRLGAYCVLRIHEIKEERAPAEPSPAQISQILSEEGKRILAKIPQNSMVISLCIEGETMSSTAFARYLQKTTANGTSSISFIIGGSWGLSEEVKKASALKLSMSPMTFPHQLARVMWCEQLYRAFQICNDRKYHK